MQNFANGKLPRFDNDMVQELADAIATLARRAGGRGMRLDFAYICAALDDDEDLAEAVLARAGFKRCSEQRGGRMCVFHSDRSIMCHFGTYHMLYHISRERLQTQLQAKHYCARLTLGEMC